MIVPYQRTAAFVMVSTWSGTASEKACGDSAATPGCVSLHIESFGYESKLALTARARYLLIAIVFLGSGWPRSEVSGANIA
jgi:hypothetical protein